MRTTTTTVTRTTERLCRRISRVVAGGVVRELWTHNLEEQMPKSEEHQKQPLEVRECSST